MKMLDVHEAENLIPIAFLRKIASNKGKNILKKMAANNFLEALVYYDVKEGIKKEDVESDKQYKTYCEELYNKIYTSKNSNFAKFLSQKQDLTAYLFDQIGSKLLIKFIEDKAMCYVDDVMSRYRKQIAELVYTCLCCRGDDPLN